MSKTSTAQAIELLNSSVWNKAEPSTAMHRTEVTVLLFEKDSEFTSLEERATGIWNLTEQRHHNSSFTPVQAMSVIQAFFILRQEEGCELLDSLKVWMQKSVHMVSHRPSFMPVQYEVLIVALMRAMVWSDARQLSKCALNERLPAMLGELLAAYVRMSFGPRDEVLFHPLDPEFSKVAADYLSARHWQSDAPNESTRRCREILAVLTTQDLEGVSGAPQKLLSSVFHQLLNNIPFNRQVKMFARAFAPQVPADDCAGMGELLREYGVVEHVYWNLPSTDPMIFVFASREEAVEFVEFYEWTRGEAKRFSSRAVAASSPVMMSSCNYNGNKVFTKLGEDELAQIKKWIDESGRTIISEPTIGERHGAIAFSWKPPMD